MRVLIGLGALAAILAADIQTASAQNRPWCLRTDVGGPGWCGFDTFARCEAWRGQGGSCIENDMLASEQQKAAHNEKPVRADADSQSGFVSWLSSKVAEVTGSSSTEPEQSAATRSVPAPQAEAPPRRRTQAATRGERVPVASRSEQARAPARSPQQSAPQAAARAEAPAPEFDDAAREALYREFHKWRVKQLFTPE
jgi:Protein of unknown function (DUF3551)